MPKPIIRSRSSGTELDLITDRSIPVVSKRVHDSLDSKIAVRDPTLITKSRVTSVPDLGSDAPRIYEPPPKEGSEVYPLVDNKGNYISAYHKGYNPLSYDHGDSYQSICGNPIRAVYATHEREGGGTRPHTTQMDRIMDRVYDVSAHPFRPFISQAVANGQVAGAPSYKHDTSERPDYLWGVRNLGPGDYNTEAVDAYLHPAGGGLKFNDIDTRRVPPSKDDKDYEDYLYQGPDAFTYDVVGSLDRIEQKKGGGSVMFAPGPFGQCRLDDRFADKSPTYMRSTTLTSPRSSFEQKRAMQLFTTQPMRPIVKDAITAQCDYDINKGGKSGIARSAYTSPFKYQEGFTSKGHRIAPRVIPETRDIGPGHYAHKQFELIKDKDNVSPAFTGAARDTGASVVLMGSQYSNLYPRFEKSPSLLDLQDKIGEATGWSTVDDEMYDEKSFASVGGMRTMRLKQASVSARESCSREGRSRSRQLSRIGSSSRGNSVTGSLAESRSRSRSRTASPTSSSSSTSASLKRTSSSLSFVSNAASTLSPPVSPIARRGGPSSASARFLSRSSSSSSTISAITFGTAGTSQGTMASEHSDTATVNLVSTSVITPQGQVIIPRNRKLARVIDKAKVYPKLAERLEKEFGEKLYRKDR